MYEYKLTALPTKGRPKKGRRGLHEAFGVAIEEKMNNMINEGWEFVEFREVPIIERRVLRSNVQRTATMMLFKRLKSQKPSMARFNRTSAPTHGDWAHEDVNLQNTTDLDRIPPAIKKMMRRRDQNLHNLPIELTEKPN